METRRADPKTALLVRRIIAIVLMALSIGCLFWPPMVTLNSEYRELLKDRVESTTDSEMKLYFREGVARLFNDFEYASSNFRLYTGKELPKYPFTADRLAKDYMSVYKAAKDGALSLAETWMVVTLGAGYFGKTMDYLDDTLDAIERADSYYYYNTNQYLNENRQSIYNTQARIEQYMPVSKGVLTLAAVGISILFFGMIAFGVLAIVMMLLDRMNLNPLHSILAALCAGIFAVLIIVGNDKITKLNPELPDNLLMPGVGLFLMPIFSLAACIVYKSGRAKKSTYAGSGQFNRSAGAWEANVTYGDRSAQNGMRTVQADGWTCPNCRSQNPASARFCIECGKQKPAPRPEQSGGLWTCGNCGTKNPANASFCMGCGDAKPAPAPAGLWTCEKCGAKNPARASFCTSCGGTKSTPQSEQNDAPNGWVCPVCDTQNETDAAFCETCGKPNPARQARIVLQRSRQQQPKPEPVPEPAPEPVQEPAPEPAPKPVQQPGFVFCIHCGAKIEEGQPFCEHCGARQD